MRKRIMSVMVKMQVRAITKASAKTLILLGWR
jgi:hypothetical protein